MGHLGIYPLTRIATAGVLIALLPPIVAAGATGYAYPRFQPVSIAFVDGQHGVLGEDDWTCHKTYGCQGRILVTGDSGAHWRVTYVGARGIHLYPVRETRIVYAMTGTVMVKSIDAGAHWQRLLWPPSVVSFVTPTLGWKIGPNTTIAHPPPPHLTGKRPPGTYLNGTVTGPGTRRYTVKKSRSSATR